MSKIKNRNFILLILLSLISIFAFGCENHSPVDSISFSDEIAKEGIVLLVDQSLNLENGFVDISPNYATNKDFNVVSSDLNKLKVENKTITALKEGNVVLTVISKDNDLKQSSVAVRIVEKIEKLTEPTGLEFNPETEIFSFNEVNGACDYTMVLNGQVFNIGNTNKIKLTDYIANYEDNVVSIKVKANVPSYSIALQESNYSEIYKFYKASAVKNAKVVSQKLTFEHSTKLYNISLNNQLKLENVNLREYDFADLITPDDAGKTINVTVESVITDKIVQTFGADVNDYFSSFANLSVKVQSRADVNFNGSLITWNKIEGVDKYRVMVNELQVDFVSENSFDLATLNKTTSASNYVLKIVPVVSKENIVLCGTDKLYYFNVLEQPLFDIDDQVLTWSSKHAQLYNVVIKYENNEILNTITQNTLFDFEGKQAGKYTFEVKALPISDGNVNYFASKVAEKVVVKNSNLLSPHIANYKLHFSAKAGDAYEINYGTGVEVVYASGTSVEYNLRNKSFLPGTNVIKIAHLGNENTTVTGAVAECSFFQLGEDNVDVALNIENSIVSASTVYGYKINVAKIDNTKEFEVDNQSVTLNSTSIDGENYLPAGEYVASVYIYGDGSTSFTYGDGTHRYKEVGFTVLPQIVFENVNVNNSRFVLNNNAQFAVFKDGEEYKTSLIEGEYQLQALGNGSSTLSSIMSETIKVEKLQPVTLDYSNNAIFIDEDLNSVDNAYYTLEFKHQGRVVNDYVLGTEFLNFASINTFSMQALANNQLGGNNGVFYINSDVSELVVEMLSNNSTIELVDNKIKITSPDSRFNKLNVKFTFGEQNVEFSLNDENKLVADVDGQTKELDYSQDGDIYHYITIINNDAFILDFFQTTFNVAVKYTSDDAELLIDKNYSQPTRLSTTIVNNTSVSFNNEDYTLTVNNGSSFMKLTIHEDVFTLSKINPELFVSADNSKSLSYTNENGVYKFNLMQNNMWVVPACETNFVVKTQLFNDISLSNNIYTSEIKETTCVVNQANRISTIQWKGDEYKILLRGGPWNKEYVLHLQFKTVIGGYELNFVADVENDQLLYIDENGNVINSDDSNLNYTYNVTTYTIELLKNNNLVKVLEPLLGKETTVTAKLMLSTNGNNDTQGKTGTIKVQKVATAESICVTSQNMIQVKAPFAKEYPVKITINGADVTNDVTFTYRYISSRATYVFDISSIIDQLISDFEVGIQFFFVENDTENVLNSDIKTETILVSKAEIQRVGQTLQFVDNLGDRADISKYALRIGEMSYDLGILNATTDGNIVIINIAAFGVSTDVREYAVITKNTQNVVPEGQHPILKAESAPVWVKFEGSSNIESARDLDNDVLNVWFEASTSSYDKTIALKVEGREEGLDLNKMNSTQIENNKTKYSFVGEEMFLEEDYSGTINLTLQFLVETQYVEGDKTVYVFNSGVTGLTLNRIAKTNNIYTDGTNLYFNNSNVAEYKILLGDTIIKDNLTSTTIENVFDVLGDYAGLSLNILAIPSRDTELNSLSNSFSINKTEKPISVEVDGDYIKVKVSKNVVDLNKISGIDLKLKLVNNYINKDLNINTRTLYINITEEDIYILASDLLNIFDNYETSPYAQNIDAMIEIDYSNTDKTHVDLYLDSDKVNQDFYTLCAPTYYTKTAGDELSWTPARNGTFAVEYQFEVVHKLGEMETTYLSTDAILQYKNGNTTSSYSNITGTTIKFPYGYIGEDGKLKVFEEGSFKVNVKAVYTGGLKTVLSSGYSAANIVKEYTILGRPEIKVVNGELAWEPVDGATGYKISVDDNVTSLAKNAYTFEDSVVGIHSVNVVAVTGNSMYIDNQLVSETQLIYRLPNDVTARVEDGDLILTMNKHFTVADITFVNQTTNVSFTYENILTEEEINEIGTKVGLFFLNFITKEELEEYLATTKDINLGSLDELGLTSGQDYTITAKLRNTNNTLPLINSISKAYDGITLHKTSEATYTVENGKFKFDIDASYKNNDTQQQDNQINFNYDFNNDLTVNKSAIYKIKINEIEIYAFDYKVFESIKGSLVENTDYAIIVDVNVKGTLYAWIKIEGLKFNVYENNLINFLSQDKISYYEIVESDYDYTQTDVVKAIELKEGSAYEVALSLIGGDSGSEKAYLTSNVVKTQKFERFGTSSLAVENGKLRIDDKSIDGYEPIYKLTMSGNENYLFYVFTNSVSMENAQGVAEREGDIVSDYVVVEKGYNCLYFDMAEYAKSGLYTISITTLATGDSHYELNSKASVGLPFFKPTDTKFEIASNGVLKFGLSSYTGDSTEYIYNYEITIGTKVIQLNVKNSQQAKLSGTTVEYLISDINLRQEYAIKIRAKEELSNVVYGVYGDVITIKKSEPVTDLKIDKSVVSWQTNNTVSVMLIETSDGKFVASFEVAGNSYDLFNLTNIKSGTEYKISVRTCQAGGGFITSDYAVLENVVMLENVETSSIKAQDGMLTWKKVEGAESYKIIFTSSANSEEKYEYSRTSETLNLAELEVGETALIAGKYSVTIQAIAGEGVSSLVAASTIEFIKLDNNITNFQIDNDGKISWTGIEDVAKYELIFEYNKLEDGSYEHKSEPIYVETTEYDASNVGIYGLFKLNIRAIGTTDEQLNGDFAEYVATTFVPSAVTNLVYDAENVHYSWTATEELIDTDKFVITYGLQQYINGALSNEVVEKSQTISVNDLKVDDKYVFEIHQVGLYTNFSVKVVRVGTIPSQTTTCAEDADFNYYNGGDGSNEKPYIIVDANQLINIKYVALRNKNFELNKAIDLSGVEISGEYLIAETFTGKINGGGQTISGIDWQLNEQSFAMFKSILGAEIKNIKFADIKMQNTFAKTDANVINLSLIATGATNSTISDVTVTMKAVIGGNVENKTLNIAALVAQSTETNYMKNIVDLTIEGKDVQNYTSNTSNFAGLVAISTSDKFNDGGQETSVTLTLNTINEGKLITNVGGAVAVANGTKLQNIKATINIASQPVSYVGGVVATIENGNVSNCVVDGSLKFSTKGYVGGVAAYAVSTTIQTSTSTVEIAVNIENVNTVKIGSVVGFAQGGTLYYEASKTEIEAGEITKLGIYGEAEGVSFVNN